MSDIFFGLLFGLLLKWNWNFFDHSRIFHSSGVPIWLLTTKKFFSHILENITKSPQTTFERFLMTTSSARSILVNFSPKKNLTSNRSKPIRVLTRIWSSCSDDRLSNAYSLSEFQAHRSNFVIHFFFSLSTRQKGVDTMGDMASFQMNLKNVADWHSLDHNIKIYNHPETFSAMFARFQLFAYNLINYIFLNGVFVQRKQTLEH